jgi:AcrR family transcriptional regulator
MGDGSLDGKRKRGRETAERIMVRAAELFAREGYDGVSVRRIAEAAGVRESSIYNHFASKADLFESLLNDFVRRVPGTRPSDAELDGMLALMEPEEVFKSILFHVGQRVSGRLANISMIISNEKYKNPRAAETYFRHVVAEPADYYARLIEKMIARGMVASVDARALAEQYNYVSIALTKEYIMAQFGLADERAVVGTMVRTLKFFCGLMTRGEGRRNEEEMEPRGEVPPV